MKMVFWIIVIIMMMAIAGEIGRYSQKEASLGATKDVYSAVSQESPLADASMLFSLSASIKPNMLHGPERAFEESTSPDNFWEVLGSYPFWLQIKYPSGRSIISYSLQAGGEELTRMPTAWQLEGSKNGIDWVILDTRKNQNKWKKNEIKDFTVSASKKYKFYRLLFTEGLDRILLRIYKINLHVLDPSQNDEQTLDALYINKGGAIFMHSSNGTRWRIVVGNSGRLTTSPVN